MDQEAKDRAGLALSLLNAASDRLLHARLREKHEEFRMHRPAAARAFALALLVAVAAPARAGEDCDAPPETWQPRSAVRALADREGWHVNRLKVDDGCYEIKGRDAEGRRFKARLDPASLRVLAVKREHASRPLSKQGEHQ